MERLSREEDEREAAAAAHEREMQLYPPLPLPGEIGSYGYGRLETPPQQQQQQQSMSQHEAPANPDDEILRPGNYLLCTWDIENLMDTNAAAGCFYQLGAFLPHGPTFIQPVVPDGKPSEELVWSGHFLPLSNKTYMAKVPGVPGGMPAKSMPEALSAFLDFLEKGQRSVRPQYDGVVLLSHVQESIPSLLRAVRQSGVVDRFERVVKGMGDMCSYLAQCHIGRLTEGGSGGSGEGGKLDLSMGKVHQAVFGIHLPDSSNYFRTDKRASCVHKVVLTFKLFKHHVFVHDFFFPDFGEALRCPAQLPQLLPPVCEADEV